MFMTGIGTLVQAMQQQTATFAERQQEQQLVLNAQQQVALQQQQAYFVARQEEVFRQQREALEALVRNVAAERPRSYLLW